MMSLHTAMLIGLLAPLVVAILTPFLAVRHVWRDAAGPIGGVITFIAAVHVALAVLDGETPRLFVAQIAEGLALEFAVTPLSIAKQRGANKQRSIEYQKEYIDIMNLLLNPPSLAMPVAEEVEVQVLLSGVGGITETDYPGLGHFPPPREAFWRRLRPLGRGRELDPQSSRATKRYGIKYRHMSLLPTVTLVGRPSGDYFMCRWVTPIDSETTLFYSFNAFRRHSTIRTFFDRLSWTLWQSWTHDLIFSDQDKKVVEEGEENYAAMVGELRLETSGNTRLRGSPLKSMIHKVETFGEEIGTCTVSGVLPRCPAVRMIICP